MNEFYCHCNAKKNHALEFDGGVIGYYVVRLCSACYLAQDKKFLIQEKMESKK